MSAAPSASASYDVLEYADHGGELLYEQGGRTAGRIKYDPEEWIALRGRISALTMEASGQGWQASGVSETVGKDIPGVYERIVETENKAVTPETESLDAGVIELAQADGAFPSMTALASVAGDVSLAVGAFAVGYEIGEAIGGEVRAWFGFEGAPAASENYLQHESQVWHYLCESRGPECVRELSEGNLKASVGYTSTGAPVEVSAPKTATFVFEHGEYGWGLLREGVYVGEPDTEQCEPRYFGFSPWNPQPPSGYTGVRAKASVGECTHGFESIYQTTPAEAAFLVPTPEPLTVTDPNFYPLRLPVKAPATVPLPVKETDRIAKPQPLLVPPPLPNIANPTAPNYVKTNVTTYVATESPEIGQREGELPSPLLPEIPQPRPAEVGTEYKTDLERAGYHNVELVTVTEAQADPRYGAEVVLAVDPTPGTKAATSTRVRVEQNPATQPTPVGGEGGPVFTPPAIPAVAIPSVPTPCDVFPFGVPCWLVNQLKGLVATPEAPHFHFTMPFNLAPEGLDVNLASIFGTKTETMMEVFRGVLLVASFVSIVWGLASMALGSGTGGFGSSGAEEAS